MKRHTRAHVREQRDRWIKKRIGQIRRSEHTWMRPTGLLSKRDPWDCGRTQCGICRDWGPTYRDVRDQMLVTLEMNDYLTKDEC